MNGIELSKNDTIICEKHTILILKQTVYTSVVKTYICLFGFSTRWRSWPRLIVTNHRRHMFIAAAEMSWLSSKCIYLWRLWNFNLTWWLAILIIIHISHTTLSYFRKFRNVFIANVFLFLQNERWQDRTEAIYILYLAAFYGDIISNA